MPCGGIRLDEGIVRLRQVRVHRAHHLVGGVRAGDGQHPRVRLADDVALGAEAAGDDDLAVLGERLADGVERFLDRGIDEAAGVDDDEIGILVAGRDEVTLGAQLREDALGIDQRLGAAEGNEPDLARWRCGHGGARRVRRASHGELRVVYALAAVFAVACVVRGFASGARRPGNRGRGSCRTDCGSACCSCCCISRKVLALCSR